MNRSTYALKSHLTTFPSSTDREQQSFCQIKGGIRQRAYLPRHFSAASNFKGITGAPVVYAQTSPHTHVRMHAHTHTHTTIKVKVCKLQNVSKPAQNTAVPMLTPQRAKIRFPFGCTSFPVITAHLRAYSSKMMPMMPNIRSDSPVNSPSANRDLIYEWWKSHGLGLD